MLNNNITSCINTYVGIAMISTMIFSLVLIFINLIFPKIHEILKHFTLLIKQGSVLKKKNHHDIATYLLIIIITEKTVSRYFFTSNKNLNNSYT